MTLSTFREDAAFSLRQFRRAPGYAACARHGEHSAAQGVFLFGVHAIDPWTMVFVAALLVMCEMLTAIVPARKAASVNPVEALRSE